MFIMLYLFNTFTGNDNCQFNERFWNDVSEIVELLITVNITFAYIKVLPLIDTPFAVDIYVLSLK